MTFVKDTCEALVSGYLIGKNTKPGATPVESSMFSGVLVSQAQAKRTFSSWIRSPDILIGARFISCVYHFHAQHVGHNRITSC